jgi:hypothetical protein
VTLKRILATSLVVGAAVVALAGCTTEARAERKGKAFGDQVCLVRTSKNSNAAQRHLRRAQDKLDDLNRFVGIDVHQDLNTVDRNLTQLANDVSAGRDVREQDVNAIARNVEAAVSTSRGAAKAAYDGVMEGLNDCT